MKRHLASAWIMLVALTCAVNSASAIDWQSAGKGTESRPLTGQTAILPKDTGPKLPDGSFNCDTVTRMSWEQARNLDSVSSGPRQVKRCSRDGLSIEITGPSN